MLSAEGGVIRGIKVSTARVEDRRPTLHARFAASRTAARLFHTPFSLSVVPLLACFTVSRTAARFAVSLTAARFAASLARIAKLTVVDLMHAAKR